MEHLLVTVARNSFFGAFGKISIKLIGFLFTILIVRWLGDEGYGRYALIWSYVVVFSMLSDAGLTMYAIRQIAKRESGSQDIAGNVIIIRVILALTGMALITATVWLLDYPAEFLFQVFLASNVLLLYAIHETLDGILQANERFDRSVAAVMAGLLVFVGTGLLFLWLGWHITGVILARLLNVFASILLVWRLLADYRQDLRWRIRPALWPQFIRVSLPFGLIKLWLSWATRIDTIILAWFWAEQVVGWYGAAYALILGIMVISNSISTALYPAMSRQYKQNPEAMPRVYELVFKYLLLLSIPIAGGIFLTADKLAHLLYGSEFTPVGLILTIMSGLIPLAFISEFLRHILLVVNREGAAVRALVVAVMLNIGLNLWLIPGYGFMAAAIVALIAETVLVAIYAWQLRDELSSVRLTMVLLKLALASSIFMLIVYKLAPLSLVLQVGISGLAYLLILWLLGIVKPNEYEALFDSIKYSKRQLSNQVITMQEVKSPNLVSVFILTYNSGQFLPQAIESVLNQTYQNFELIIIDDGSTDDTAQILQQYQAHPRVRIYHNPANLGISPSWNIALGLCQGEYIAKLDADDFYEPGQLETVVAFFKEHPAVGLVFSGLNLIYPDGHQEIELMFPHSWVRPRESFLSILLERCIIRAPTVFVRRVCYEKLGGVVEEMKLHSDWEMWIRVAANYPVGYIARRLASYRLSYGLNSTAKAITDGHSLYDLRLWLNLLAEDKLPYRLSEAELIKFRWGLYDLVMHFAGIAAYHQHEEMAKVYTAFAEEMLLPCQPSSNIEHLRQTHLNLHQGIYAFQSHQHRKAMHHFLQALKIKGGSLSEVWLELGLTLKIIRRLSAGFYRRVIVKYYSG